MSLFGTILSKIFPSNHPAVASAQSNQQPASQQGGAAAQRPAGQQGGAAQSGGQATQPGAGGASATNASAAAQPVDVERILDDMAQKNAQKLNWRTSIVDLMKLLGMDSSLGARKQLAQELHYSGDTNDSAAMNIWLHKQVMQKLADNGGKVPGDLLKH